MPAQRSCRRRCGRLSVFLLLPLLLRKRPSASSAEARRRRGRTRRASRSLFLAVGTEVPDELLHRGHRRVAPSFVLSYRRLVAPGNLVTSSDVNQHENGGERQLRTFKINLFQCVSSKRPSWESLERKLNLLPASVCFEKIKFN